MEKPIPIEKNAAQNKRNLIVSHHTLDANYLDYTMENHKSYAKKNFYDYWFRNGKIDQNIYFDENGSNKILKHGLYWQKIEAVKQALALKNDQGENSYEWIMWVDADAFFTDFNKKMEDILKDITQDDFMVISKDYPGGNCVNAGIWMIKNNENGKNFISLVEKSYYYYKNNMYPEQQAMQDLIFGYVSKSDLENQKVLPYQHRTCEEYRIIKGVKVLPQRSLNSYYTKYAVGVTSASWQPGDYIAHMAAGGDRLTLVRRLMSCIKEKGIDLTGCEINGSWVAP